MWQPHVYDALITDVAVMGPQGLRPLALLAIAAAYTTPAAGLDAAPVRVRAGIAWVCASPFWSSIRIGTGVGVAVASDVYP